jgi:DNA-binding NtrC family response regulator
MRIVIGARADNEVASERSPAPSPEAAAGGADPRLTESVWATQGDRILVQRFTLRAVGGPNAGAVHEAAAESVIVGTHASADFVLQDPSVSRFHCEVTVGKEGVLVRDLGSLNGTIVDGVGVFHARLRSGSTLTLGRTQIQLHLGREQLELPLSTRGEFGVAVGRSPAMKRVFAVLERAAASDATLLLEGETGTGKEVIAESVHRESPRHDGPFVVVDCGAIPHDLLESELFGHEKGAFTGAVAAREGAFEAASGGTLLLDEIGELPEDLQPKLLRALERREVKRVGSNKHVKVDVRLVAATNRDLRAEVNAKRFRPDLYYRLAVVQIRLPPLRERTEDIPLLVERIVVALGAADRPEASLLRSPQFLSGLASHAWPGNVRELRNYVERCLALAAQAPFDESPARQGESAPAIDPTVPLRQGREAWVRHFERNYLERLLAHHGNNVSAAARAAGVERIHLYRLLWRHGLR